MDQIAEPHRPRRGRKPGEHAAPASVQVLDRALTMLEIVSTSDGALLTDIADAAGMALSTTHRLLTSLASHGMVSSDPETGQWTIGVKAFEIGNGFLRHRKLGIISRPFLMRLMEESGETANLAIEDAGDVVFLSQVESHAPMRAFFRPGRRGPMHASGIGKAILAARPDREVAALIGRRKLERFTDKTLDTQSALQADLEAIRARGWSIDDEEHTLGMRCIAAPVFNEYGEAVAGLSVSGPAVRLPYERVGDLGPKVRAAADALTAASGGRKPGERCSGQD
jgi:IclR family acetate operon transcriptional repressor